MTSSLALSSPCSFCVLVHMKPSWAFCRLPGRTVWQLTANHSAGTSSYENMYVVHLSASSTHILMIWQDMLVGIKWGESTIKTTTLVCRERWKMPGEGSGNFPDPQLYLFVTVIFKSYQKSTVFGEYLSFVVNRPRGIMMFFSCVWHKSDYNSMNFTNIDLKFGALEAECHSQSEPNRIVQGLCLILALTTWI